jgi:hypothetical protein
MVNRPIIRSVRFCRHSSSVGLRSVLAFFLILTFSRSVFSFYSESLSISCIAFSPLGRCKIRYQVTEFLHEYGIEFVAASYSPKLISTFKSTHLLGNLLLSDFISFQSQVTKPRSRADKLQRMKRIQAGITEW